VTALVGHEIDRIGQLRTRPAMANPDRLIDLRAEELTRWVARWSELAANRIEREHSKLAHLASQLRALSPKHTLERGYAIARLPSGAALRDPAEAPPGTRLRLTVAAGEVAAKVEP